MLSQKPDRAVEVKWSDRYFSNPGELKSLTTFLSTNKLDRAVVTTATESGIKEFDAITLQFVPTALYAYTKGKESVKISS